jgi:UDP-N-acetylglucosamine--N-acetylmuramyl-(pentapeptide) pyrophosphoryl-undecaprenol N-acetylglucosamine transferase
VALMAERHLIAIAAGGTGGHMYPAASLAYVLKRRGYDVLLITDVRGNDFASQFKDVPIHIIASGSPTRGGFRAYASVFKGRAAAGRILKKKGVTAAVGFGGYPALPTMLAAKARKIPYCLHEQNAVLGRVNRLVAKHAKAIAVSFPATKLIPGEMKDKVHLTGNPVRRDISAIGSKGYRVPRDDRNFNILVIGGSQGARIFSDIVPEALINLSATHRARLSVTQQCRSEDVPRVARKYSEAGLSAKSLAFVRDMATAYSRAHLVISRAGAGAVSEVAAACRPAIFVPLDISADDHQSVNARSLSDRGGAFLIDQGQFTTETLTAFIKGLLEAPIRLEAAAQTASGMAIPFAARNLADVMGQRLFGKRGGAAQ